MELFTPQKQRVWIELNGVPVATAQSIQVSCIRQRRAVKAFGESEPVAWLERPATYRLQLTQLMLREENLSPADFYGLTDFYLVTVQGNLRTVYSGCEWQEITEQAQPGGGALAEAAIVTALRRTREES